MCSGVTAGAGICVAMKASNGLVRLFILGAGRECVNAELWRGNFRGRERRAQRGHFRARMRACGKLMR
ncbi:hypothetical protein D6V10_21170 [Vibrio cholerae]|nr:hypothetical protein [Vibrio cholerae]